MKRIGYLYESIYSIENIMSAIEKASKGKNYRQDINKVLKNPVYWANEVQKLLKTQTYTPTPYRHKRIREGSNQKPRDISILPFFPDQIIHTAVVQILEPIFMKGMYYHSYGSIPKRGTHKAKKYLQSWLRSHKKKTKYCLQLDVSKFYPSIDKNILKEKLRQKIKDKKCLWLLDTIINTSDGLPIGNYTSQWFANFYLQDLDHYIKEKLNIKFYMRYMDDMVLLSSNKRNLSKTRLAIHNFLIGEKLTLKSNWQVFKVDDRSINFLGFRFWHYKTTLRKSILKRIKRKLLKKSNKIIGKSLASYIGWLCHSNNFILEMEARTKCRLINQVVM